jgi:hypothetical protein
VREDVIHHAVREYLKSKSWRLLAGQYPQGSDNLPPLNIVDPALARDMSPDHRRHSLNKIVPDLVACAGLFVLLVEVKPEYSSADEAKLDRLVRVRNRDLRAALAQFETTRRIRLCGSADSVAFVPCLAMSKGSRFPRREDFSYLLIGPDLSVEFVPSALLPSLEAALPALGE